MTTRGVRLKEARERHFKSARAAAKAMGIPAATYGAHERAEAPGGRDYGPDEARQYARRFGVTPEWLLTGATSAKLQKAKRWASPTDPAVEVANLKILMEVVRMVQSVTTVIVRELEKSAAEIADPEIALEAERRGYLTRQALLIQINKIISELDSAANTSTKLLSALQDLPIGYVPTDRS